MSKAGYYMLHIQDSSGMLLPKLIKLTAYFPRCGGSPVFGGDTYVYMSGITHPICAQ